MNSAIIILKHSSKCPCLRTSVCPLSDGCEPLCNLSAGFPDDCWGPEAAGGSGCRQAAQRHLPQRRLPAAAPQPWHEPGEGEETATGPNDVKIHTDTRKSHEHQHTHTHSHTPTHTSLWLQWSLNPGGGNTISDRAEANSLDKQEASGTCQSSLAEPLHRRRVSRKNPINAIKRYYNQLVFVWCVSAGLWREIRPHSRLWV